MELTGQIVGGRFEIVRMIGQGGMGAVFEARHETLPRKFAIKILRPELAQSPEFVQRFRREAIAAGRIEHPNVVYITDFGHMDDGSLYLVMEYLEGEGLDQVLSRHVRLPLSRAIPILAQIADALDAAHCVQVVHRDLKPENILLTEVRGRKDVIKIFDFGIARVRTAEFMGESLTMRGQVFGTAEYMSPEHATGEECDGRSDIYAVGCLAYELLTGEPPFSGEPMHVLQAHVNRPVTPPSMRLKDHPVPSAYDALVLRCLAKDPAQRYQSASELRQDLLKIRGLLFSMGADIARADRSMPSSPSVKHLTQGWRSLGGQVPELFSSGNDPVVVNRTTLATDQRQGAVGNIEQLHEDFHDILRELAMSLVQALMASKDITEALERLLAVEEEIASLTGTIALSEQNFDRIRYEYGQREKRLRYAIFDLTMERAQVEGRAKAAPEQASALQPQIDDYAFQINELQKSVQKIVDEKSLEIQELDQQVKEYRNVRQQRELEGSSIYEMLHAQVEALRPSAQQPEILQLYGRLDGLRQVMGAAV